MPEGISSVSGRAIFRKNEITRPAAPSPASDASDASGNYSQEGRYIVSLLDKIGRQLIDKEKKGGTLEDLDVIITSSQSQDLKKSLKEKYNPEVITAAINEKLRRLKTASSAHTDLSKPVYIAFLEKFLSELKEQSRAATKALSLPDIKKPN